MSLSVKEGNEKVLGRKDSGNDQSQYLTFVLSEEVFAIGILAREIIEYSDLTVVPMMPECIRGVINVRGSVVPVVDLSSRFGRAAMVPGRRTCIVIVEVEADGERQDIGVIVDAVNEVQEIPPLRDRTCTGIRDQDRQRLHRRHGQSQRALRDHPRHQSCRVYRGDRGHGTGRLRTTRGCLGGCSLNRLTATPGELS